MASGSCAGSLAKFILLLINLQFIILALGLILFGSRLQMAKQSAGTVSDEVIADAVPVTWSTLATGCIVVGAILGIISLFGFGAALCESTPLLNTYAYFLMVCVVLLGGAYVATLSVLLTNSAVDQARQYYRNLMVNYSGNNNSEYIVDKAQLLLFCCGDRSPDDWHNQTWLAGNTHGNTKHDSTHNGSSTHHSHNQTSSVPHPAVLANSGPLTPILTSSYPSSCCGVPSNTTHKYCPASELKFNSGCFSPVQVSRYRYFAHAFYLALLAAVMLLLAISCCLERDHQLQQSKLVNMQYAAHLETCRGGRMSRSTSARYFLNPPAPTAASRYRAYGGSNGADVMPDGF